MNIMEVRIIVFQKLNMNFNIKSCIFKLYLENVPTIPKLLSVVR
jgi:hypothetical protein